MNFDLAYMLEIIPELLVYIPITLYLAIVSMIIAVAIGVVLSLLLVNKTPVLLQLSKLYISSQFSQNVSHTLSIMYASLR